MTSTAIGAAMRTVTDFLVNKADLHQTKFEERSLPPLAEGEVLLKVDRFADLLSATANALTVYIGIPAIADATPKITQLLGG